MTTGLGDCTELAAVYVEAMCVHEHRRTGGICAMHAAPSWPSPAGCRTCAEAGHWCLLVEQSRRDLGLA